MRTTLGTKFALLLGIILVFSITALTLLHQNRRRASAALLAAEVRERSGMVGELIALISRSQKDFTAEYAHKDDMVRLVEGQQRRWVKGDLDEALRDAHASGAWVLRVDGTVIYATLGVGHKPPPPLPIPPAELLSLIQKSYTGNFFVQLPGRLVELSFAPILPAEDTRHETAPRGWFLVEKNWDAAQVRVLSNLIRCEGRIEPPGTPLPAPGADHVTLRHSLRDAAGEAVADFVYTLKSEEHAIASTYGRIAMFLAVFSSLATAAMVVGAVYHWVLLPVSAIGHSIAQNDLAALEPLLSRDDEMGQLARVTRDSFAQRAELDRYYRERAQLSRDLHDGVIQSVFAAGMTLAGAQASIEHNPAAATKTIGAVRDALNTTIHELRAYIEGLRPESTTEFSQSVRTILALIQGVRPLGFEIQIDDEVCKQLNEKIRYHLLHIVREGVTNCARHTQAQKVRISLRREPDGATLEVIDNGGGFAAHAKASRGNGVTNLADRTRELGGSLHIESTPGQGVRLQSTFPLPRSA